MNRRIIVLVGVAAFAVTLAIVLGSRLSGEALLVVLGIALGVVLGIPVGAMAVLVGRRTGQAEGDVPGMAESSSVITLTDEQAELLSRALGRPQASAEGFRLASRQGRQFSAVGGADLADSSDDTA